MFFLNRHDKTFKQDEMQNNTDMWINFIVFFLFSRMIDDEKHV